MVKFKMMIWMLVVVLLSSSVLAADPGHLASSISTGTFEYGNFTFPDYLTIEGGFNVTNAFVVGQDGKIGIGTTSPDELLTLESSGGSTVLLFNESTGVDSVWRLRTQTSGGNGFEIYGGAETAQASRLFIGSNGAVGIGVILPNSTLSVAGDGNFTGGISATQMCLGTDCRTFFPLNDTFSQYDTWNHNQTALSIGWVQDQGYMTAGGSGDSPWAYTGTEIRMNDTFASLNVTDTLFVNASSVGVGTMNPAAPLHISSASTDGLKVESTGGNADIWLFDSGTTAGNTRIRADAGDLMFITGGSTGMVIDGSRNVGIGTSSPGSLLELESSSGSTTLLLNETTGVDTVWEISSNNDATGTLAFKGGYVDVDGESILSLDANGRVGVNTDTPNATLEVDGRIAGQYGEVVKCNTGCAGTCYNVGTLPHVSVSTYQKLKVEIFGGSWDESQTGEETYYVSSRELAINREVHGGAVGSVGGAKYNFSIFNSSSSYEAVVCITANYPSFSIRSWYLDGDNMGLKDVNITHFDPTSKEDVTPTINTIFATTHAGNVGIGTDSPTSKLYVSGDINSTGGVSAAQMCLGSSCITEWGETGGGGSSASPWTYTGTEIRMNDTFASLNVTDTLFVNASSVGIGTMSPDYTLDVVGNIRAKAANHQIRIHDTGSGADEWTITTHTDDHLGFYEDGSSNRLFLEAGGNIGIGTAAPGQLLSLESSSGTTAILLNETSGVDTNWEFRANNDASGSMNIYGGNDGSQANVMTFLSGGNVGIGTTSPGNTLNVIGTANISAGYPALYFEETGTASNNYRFDVVSGVFKLSEVGQGVRWSIDTSGQMGIGIIDANSTLSVSGDGNFTGGVSTTQLCLTGDSCRTTWPSGGGSSVSPWTYTGTEIRMNDTFASLNVSNNLFVNGSTAWVDGKLGVGTDSPTVKLEVNSGNDNGVLKLESTDSTANIQLLDSGTSNAVAISRVSNNLVLVKDGGNVGIGTTVPGSMLAVTGSSGVNITNTGAGFSLLVNDAAGDTTPFIINESGGVGIGTTTPNTDLEVVGNVNISGETDDGRLFIGGTSGRNQIQIDSSRVAHQGWGRGLYLSSGLQYSGVGEPGDNSNYTRVAGEGGGAAIILRANSEAIDFWTAPVSTGLDNHSTAASKLLTLEYGNKAEVTNVPFVVNTNDLYVDNTTSKVGIGDNTPTSMLDVAGDINATGGVSATQMCLGTDCRTFFPLNDTFSQYDTWNHNQTALSIGWVQDQGYGTGGGGDAITSPFTYTGTEIRMNDTFASLNVTDTLFVNASSVGVGTMEPAAEIHLQTSSTTGQGMYIDASSVTTGDGLLIEVDAATMSGGFPFRITRDGTTRLSISETGIMNLYGGIRGGGGSAPFPGIAFVYDTNTGFYNDMNNLIGFTTDGTSRMVITNTGNVGIGIFAPNSSLVVTGDGNFSGGVSMAELCLTGDTCRTTWPAGSGGGDAITSPFTYTGTEIRMNDTFASLNVTDTLFVNASSVGIGTMSPDYTLDVVGNIRAKAANHQIRIHDTGSGADEWTITTHTDDHLGFYEDGSTNRLFLEAGGNIGIGTAAPGSILSITDDSGVNITNTGAGFSLLVNDAAGDTSAFIIDADGNVGIGDNTPNAKLHINGGTVRADSGSDNLAIFEGNEGNDNITISSGTDDYITFNVNDPKMHIDGTGVGIGNTTPAYNLHIVDASAEAANNPQLMLTGVGSGDSAMAFELTGAPRFWQVGVDNSDGDKFKIRTGSTLSSTFNSPTMVVDTSGNVGVGTHSPGSKLSVIGDVNLTGGDVLLQNNQAIIGYRSGDDLPYDILSVQGDNEVRIGLVSGNDFEILDSGGNTLLYLTDEGSTGNLGIGESSPTSKLHVSGDGNFTGSISIQGNSGSTNDLRVWESGTTGGITVRSDGANNNWEIQRATAGAEAEILMYGNRGVSEIHSNVTTFSINGGVGINVTRIVSPYVLDIEGPMRERSGFIYVGDDDYLIQQSTADNFVMTKVGTGGAEFSVVGDGTDYENAYIKIGNGSKISSGIDKSALDDTYFNLNGGNVGIGTDSPGSALEINVEDTTEGLHVLGGSGGTVLARFQRDVGDDGWIDMRSVGSDVQINYNDEEGEFWSMGIDAGVNGFRIAPTNLLQNEATGMGLTIINNTGNVGIGNTNPAGPLQVDDSDPVLLILNETDSGYGLMRFTNTGFIAGWYVGMTGGEKFGISTNQAMESGAEFIITQTGNIGIGTNSPNGTFQVYDPADYAVFQMIGVAPSTTANDDRGIEIRDDTYPDGKWAHRFVKADFGGGVPMFIQKTTSNEANWLNVTRYGSYTANKNDFEVFNDAAFATNSGQVGVGTIDANATLEVMDSSGMAQLRASYDGATYTNITTNADGDTIIENTGGDIIFRIG